MIATFLSLRTAERLAAPAAARRVRRLRRSTVLGAVVGGLAVALAAGCGTVAGTPVAQGAAQPGSFAPYVDISTPGRPNLVTVTDKTGNASYVLSFALAAQGRCEPAWGGKVPLQDPKLKAETEKLVAQGGQVIAATGGALGPYLENSCGSASELAAAYGTVLDATGATSLDVDIEAPVPVGLVAEALKQLQTERGTSITLTLPVNASGLTAEGLDVVQKVRAAGVVASVNVMLMNFQYDGSQWGQAMVTATSAVIDQVRTVSPGVSEPDLMRAIGVTIMIGRNDLGMVTTLDDARTILDYAKSRSLGSMRFWSLTRDNGKCPGNAKAQFNCSGVAQGDFEFTNLLKGFTT